VLAFAQSMAKKKPGDIMNFKELRDKKLRPIFDKISKELSEKGINHEVIDENDYDAYSSDNYIGMIFPDHGDTGFEQFNNPTISIVHHTERGYLDVHTVIVNEMGGLAQYRLDEDTENKIEEHLEKHIKNFLNDHILNRL